MGLDCTRDDHWEGRHVDAEQDPTTQIGDRAGRDIHRHQSINISDGSAVTADRIGGVYNEFNTYEAQQRWLAAQPDEFLPLGIPALPADHLPRDQEQSKLYQQLTGPDTQIVYLHGLPGVGKSTLAAALAGAVTESDFRSGVLWGDLEKQTPGELMRQLLIMLDGPEYAAVPQPNEPLRELFWRRIAGERGAWLLVVDHVPELRRLQDLLPTRPEQLGACRVLAVGNAQQHGLPAIWRVQEMPLAVLEQGQAMSLYTTALGPERARHFSKALGEICSLIDNNVQLLLASARLFARGALNPVTYLERLRRQEVQQAYLVGNLMEGLDPIIGSLSPVQQQLFEYLGVLGEGEWDASLLAAIAMRPVATILSDLEAIVATRLIEQRHRPGTTATVQPPGQPQFTNTTSSRYRTGALVKAVALNRLQARGDYVVRAAQTLLTRACLDRAQDYAAANQARLAASGSGTHQPRDPGVRLSEGFRASLAADLPHIRQALRWAIANRDWHLLRRFAYLPYTEVVQGFSANSFDITMSLQMATIEEPAVWPPVQGQAAFVRVPSGIHVANWSIHPNPRPATADDPVQLTGNTHVADPTKAEPTRCELNWDLTACHIVDGVFQGARFTDSRWEGVRAPDLVLYKTDIDGSHLYACDLSGSTWVHVDARHTSLNASSLRFALLRDVQLNGAELHEVDLFGATLEDVRLGGASARLANFSGAVLRDVSLRRADLTGAVFQGAWLYGVDFRGAHLLPGQLNSAAHVADSCVFDDPIQRPPMAHGRESGPSRRLDEAALQEAVANRKSLIGADLRALQVERLLGVGINAARADLRATRFVPGNCRLTRINLAGASLRGADLSAIELTGADLREADARAACLAGSILHEAHLERANLRGARLVETMLQKAHLEQADLFRADLRKADLSHASLQGATLAQADLRGAHLEQAQLVGANLQGCDLRGANLTEANLIDADLSGADLSTAIVSDEQLLCAAALGRAQLPGGREAQIIAGQDLETLPDPPDLLRFSSWRERYVGKQLPPSLDLQGAELSGKFINVSLDTALLKFARLTGHFSGCTFRDADLRHARLRGVFSFVDFRGAIFDGADLTGADFVSCELDETDLEPTQLQQASRLRGSSVPRGKGALYDGRYKLPGDLEDALTAGISTDDEHALREIAASRDHLPFIAGR